MLNLHTMSRRHFSRTLTSLLPALGFAGSAYHSGDGIPDAGGISHTAEAIHHEVVIKANRKRVYEALTDEGQFRKLSGGMDTKISREAGGAFSLFGGVITGRHIELVPGERIVQAWRSECTRRILHCPLCAERARLRHQDRFRPHRLPSGQGRTPRLRLESSLLGWACALLCFVDLRALATPKKAHRRPRACRTATILVRVSQELKPGA